MIKLNDFLIIEENDNIDDIMYRVPYATWYTLKADGISISRPRKLPAYYVLSVTNYRGNEQTGIYWDDLWSECSKEEFSEELAESLAKHKREKDNYIRLANKEQNTIDELIKLITKVRVKG